MRQVEFRFTPAEGQQVSTTVVATITAGTNEIPARDALEGVPEGVYDVAVRLVDVAGQRSAYSDPALPIRVHVKNPSTPMRLRVVGN